MRPVAGPSRTLAPAVNTVGDEYEPLPSSDGSRLIVMADGGLYETRKTQTGWSARVKLGADVNVNGTEIGPAAFPRADGLCCLRATRRDRTPASSLSGMKLAQRHGHPSVPLAVCDDRSRVESPG